MFQNITQIVKKKLMISSGEIRKGKSKGQRCHYLAVKKLSALLRRVISKHHGDYYCLNCVHHVHMKKYVKIKTLQSHNTF